jgi:putative ABC transport system ATP-binding protein
VYLKIQNIIPKPIPNFLIKKSEIWDKSFTIKPKEKVLVYAESGKGKSTFINIIAGIRFDYTGNLYLKEKNIRNFSDKEIIELRKNALSIVSQGLLLFDELTVLENIYLKNNLTNYKSQVEIFTMLQEFKIEEFKNKKVKKLSFGQKQRVAILRALCQPYSFILLDEPFSHLDNNNMNNCLELIFKYSDEQNAGIVLSALNDNISPYFSKKLLV